MSGLLVYNKRACLEQILVWKFRIIDEKNSNNQRTCTFANLTSGWLAKQVLLSAFTPSFLPDFSCTLAGMRHNKSEFCANINIVLLPNNYQLVNIHIFEDSYIRAIHALMHPNGLIWDHNGNKSSSPSCIIPGYMWMTSWYSYLTYVLIIVFKKNAIFLNFIYPMLLIIYCFIFVLIQIHIFWNKYKKPIYYSNTRWWTNGHRYNVFNKMVIEYMRCTKWSNS